MVRPPILSPRELLLLKILLITAAGFWIYAPVLHGAWLMDDDLYLPNNPLRHDPARLWKIWFAPGNFIEYYPIEETLQGIQWQLWGNNTFPYHGTNVALHILDATLVWRLLAKFGLNLAWIGGLLFVVHPVAVESVAWISEFKNTLSLAPFLLALCAWIDYEENRRPRDYLLALGLFLLAMLCKITMAPFPFVILLFAWWKRSRIGWADLKASAPFFAISALLGIVSILAGGWFLQLHHTTPDRIELGGVFSRLDRAGLVCAFSFSQFFWPVRMHPLGPLWMIDPSTLRQFLPWPILLGGVAWVWTQRKRWGRHALLGFGFFLLFLAPFLGFNAISYMKFAWVMDHLLYLPMIGLIGLVVAALSDLNRQLTLPGRLFEAGTVAIMLALLANESHTYAGIFVRPTVFYAYVLARNPHSWADHNSLGNALRKEGRTIEAIEQFRQASLLDPGAVAPLNNLGGILMQSGRYAEAAKAYEQAIQTGPTYAEAHTGLGNTLLLSGHVTEAIQQYEMALRIAPDSAPAHNGLSNALIQSGRLPEALAQSEEALKLSPDYVEAHCTLGLILARQGRIPEAIAQFEAAEVFAPNDPRITTELASLRAVQENAGEKQ